MNPERIKEAIIRLSRDKNLDPQTRHTMIFDIGCVCDEECSYLEDIHDVDPIPDVWDEDDIVELSDGFDDEGFLPASDWEP